MRILLLGGYGVCGSRLAELLVREGHAVTVAGRSAGAAQALADRLGCRAMVLDREGPLDALAGQDVVVDAAGPFHSYGADRYQLARAALAAGAHYLDLSDDAGFCAGLTELDPMARQSGLCALSGLSSVPALSSAAVVALSAGARPRVIDTAILPGNRAPRGLSVMRSILEGAGRGMPVWRGGRWCRVTGWSDPKDYVLPGGLIRQGWQIAVPDQRLFPARFGAETVIFRAGLELGVMRYGLAAFAALRRIWAFPVTPGLVRVAQVAAGALAPFGSGRGGMSVTVTTGTERRSWRLLAEDGDGPFIPGVAARALLRRDVLPPGAGPAVAVVTLDEAEAAMSDLRVVTERVSDPVDPIFRRVLGDAFDRLPDIVRRTHLTAERSHWSGTCDVTRGTGLWPRLLCALFGFPPEGRDQPVEVVKTTTKAGETWDRRFGRRRFRSHLSVRRGGMEERFGPFSFALGLHVAGGALHYPVSAGRIGPLQLPRCLLPVSVAREQAANGVFRFDVDLRAPLTGQRMVHYRGWLAEDTEDPAVR
jgi:hypothetical protein